jgi:hypothetical protein
MKALILLLVWVNGAFIGALLQGVWIWWQLATGRKTVKPLPSASGEDQ